MNYLLLAAEAAVDGQYLDDLLVLAVKVATPILMVFASWAAIALARKWGIEGKATFVAIAQSVTRAGIGYAEQWGKKYLAERGEKAPSSLKLEKAIQHIAMLEGKHHLANAAADLISRRIHSELGEQGVSTIVVADPIQPDQ